ncbi:MAG TPA: benzoylformate decarboxylase [Solirubrobacteraceae bacterium]|jgi:benzoylformate decarboxylase|nr:benzoylformate decarboxylase [Solirubrobacteraceae bacterium]
MQTVRDALHELLRAQGMTTIFGNPGSTELPMLAELPDEFGYVLGLHEGVAVGMADGYAQITGKPVLVNLHTAPGLGNAMGAIFTAQANKAPLLITAGQQARSLMTMQATLTNRDAIRVPHPFVKWSFEPPRAQDVPHALARGAALAAMAPSGPVFVSIPMDDWQQPVEQDAAAHAIGRRVSRRAGADPLAVAQLAEDLAVARRPALIAGPEIDASGAWAQAVALAEHATLEVWASPLPGSGRIGFPEDHPRFRGVLPPAVGPLSQTLEGYDLVLVVGAPVFCYYPNIPGPLLPEGTRLVLIGNDPDEAARAPMGDAIIGDVALTLRALLECVPAGDRPAPEPVPAPEPAPASTPMSGAQAVDALKAALPEEAILVVEAPAVIAPLRQRLRISRPASYFLTSGGGLGFGLAASVGIQLGCPQRPVVAVLGEGSAQYAIQALWTAAAYEVPLTVLIMRNDEYAILKWFGALEGATDAPGLDLPGLDVAALANAYGVPAQSVDEPEQLVTALREAIATDGPRLVQARIAPGMAPL